MARRTPHPVGEAWDRRPDESQPAWEAFRIYRDLRSSRSHARVAAEVGKSVELMSRWSRRDEWVERARAFDAYEDRLRLQSIADGIRKMGERHTQTGQLLAQVLSLPAQALAAKYREDPEAVMRELAALDTVGLIRLARDATHALYTAIGIERLARGEPTEVVRQDVLHADVIDLPEDDERLVRVARILRDAGALDIGPALLGSGADAEDDALHPA